MSFELSKITQVGPAILLLTFSNIPKMSDETDINDSLNIFNYSISGPGSVFVSVITQVPSDPYSVYLYLNNNLDSNNNWTLNIIGNILDVLGNFLSGNLFINFDSQEFVTNSITGGAENETASQLLRRFINPKLAGKNWNALIEALATGEQNNYDNAILASAQLFRSSASEKYLLQRGSDFGIKQPKNVGLSDELFRKYLNQIINRQLTLQSLNEILEIFYGIDGTHATSISQNFEPFQLGDGWDFNISINGENPVTVIFNSSDFDDIANVSALEVSSIINENFELINVDAYVLPYFDISNNVIKLKIITNNVGTFGSIKVTGGRAQNAFKFDKWIDVYTNADPLPTWDVTKILTNNRIRFSTTTDPTSLDLSLVVPGDYVNIYGSEFNINNIGSFEIKNIYKAYPGGNLFQYFEIENQLGVNQTSTVQLFEEDLLFFNPIKKTIYSISPVISAFVGQSGEGALDAILPATSSAIVREELTGSYLQDYDSLALNSGSKLFGIFGSTSGFFQLTDPSALPTGFIYSTIINNLKPSYIVPSTIPGSPGTVDQSSLSIWSDLSTNPQTYADGSSVTLNDGTVIIIGGYDPSLAALISFSNKFVKFSYDGFSDYTWSSGNLNSRRHFCATSLLFDGTQVFVTGGASTPATLSITSTELINPISGVSTIKANMNAGRQNHAQVTLSNTKVLVCGGVNAVGTPLNSVEIYDTTSNTWTNKASMLIARTDHYATLLDDGTVFVCGGTMGSGITTEIYDPIGDTWTFVGNRTYVSTNGPKQIIKLKDGRILSVGSFGYIAGHSAVLTSNYITEIYDPKTKFWIRGPDLIPDLFNDNTIAAQDIAVASFYLPDIKMERILAVQRAYSGTVNVVQSQFLDIPRFDEIVYLPKNVVEFKWRKGPNLVFNNMLGSFNLTKSNNNSILISNALVDNGGGPQASNIANLYIANADEWGAANFSKPGTIALLNTSTDIITFNSEYRIPSEFDVSNATLQFIEAPISDGIAGPYIWDTDPKSIVIADPQTTLVGNLYVGQSYSEITVASTVGFPDSGYLVFNYGLDDNLDIFFNLAYPIKYTKILSSTKIKIDPSYIFNKKVSNGSYISYVSQLEPYDPINAESLGSFYLTDTPAGRIAAQNALNKIVAGGIPIKYNIKYPSGLGLGGQGFPLIGAGKKSDVIYIWDDPDIENDT